MKKTVLLPLLLAALFFSQAYSSHLFDQDSTPSAPIGKRKKGVVPTVEVKRERHEEASAIPPIPAAAISAAPSNAHDDDLTIAEEMSQSAADEEHATLADQPFNFNNLDHPEKFTLSMLRAFSQTKLITYDIAARFLQEQLTQKRLSSDLEFSARVGLGIMHGRGYTSVLTDEETASLLLNIINEYAKTSIINFPIRPEAFRINVGHEAINIEVKYLLAKMRFLNRTSLIIDDQAVRFLQEAIDSQHSSPALKVTATHLSALMQSSGPLSYDTNDLVSSRLLKARESRHLSQEDKDFATFQLARMCFAGLTKDIPYTGEITFWLQAKNSPHLSQYYKDYAALRLAMMQSRYREIEFKDVDVERCLLRAKESRFLNALDRGTAEYELALMCSEKRTQIYKEDSVAEKFLLHAKDSPLLSDIAAKGANYGLALMCSEQRTQIFKDDKVAAQLLKNFLTNTRVMVFDKNRSILIGLALAQMKVENRAPDIADLQVFQLLRAQFNLMKDTSHLKKAASLLHQLASRLPDDK